MNPFICNCGAKKGKHRRDHWCDVWEARHDDPADDTEQRLDERDRSRAINAEGK